MVCITTAGVTEMAGNVSASERYVPRVLAQKKPTQNQTDVEVKRQDVKKYLKMYFLKALKHSCI